MFIKTTVYVSRVIQTPDIFNFTYVKFFLLLLTYVIEITSVLFLLFFFFFLAGRIIHATIYHQRFLLALFSACSLLAQINPSVESWWVFATAFQPTFSVTLG